MGSRDLRLLHLPSEAWGDLTSDLSKARRIRYVVGVTDFNGTWRVALVLVRRRVVGAVIVRKYSSPNLRQHELEFRAAEPFSQPTPWESVSADLPAALKRNVDRDDGAALPPKTGAGLEAALVSRSPDVEDILTRMRDDLQRPRASGTVEVLLREQRDAVALGLEMAGIESREIVDEVGDDDTDVPFLTGLSRRRVSEAATLRHESTVFDDWLPAHAEHFDMSTFQDPEDPARKVTVFYADKEKLERQTGTDLIYYRHHRPGFVLVQYKRMRALEAPGSSATYFPDEQLQTELDRFRALPAGDAATAQDWRLTEDSFFVKLVRDDLAKPTGNRLVWGMYLPLSLVELLLEDAVGGHRARGWSSDSITTYLSNGEFLGLAKQGYIGSRGALTEHLKKVIQGSFQAGRGVVLAVDETDPARSRRLRHG